MFSQRQKLSKATLKDTDKRNRKRKIQKVYSNPWTAARGEPPEKQVEKKTKSPCLANILPELNSRDSFTSQQHSSATRSKILASASRGSGSLASVSQPGGTQLNSPGTGSPPPPPERALDLEGDDARDAWCANSGRKRSKLEFSSQACDFSTEPPPAGGGPTASIEFASQCGLGTQQDIPDKSPGLRPPPAPRRSRKRPALPQIATLRREDHVTSSAGSKGTPDVPMFGGTAGTFCTPVDQVIQQPNLADMNEILMKNQRRSQMVNQKKPLAVKNVPPDMLCIERRPLPIPPLNKFLCSPVEEVKKWQSEGGKKSNALACEVTTDSRLTNAYKRLSGKVRQGNFGSVTKVVNRHDGCVYAIKLMKGKLTLKAQCREMMIMAALASQGSCDDLVRYHAGWFEDGAVCISMEFCERGSLDTLAERFPDFKINLATLRKVFKSIASALSHMHAHDLVHLDVKPENVFVTQSWEFKLGDFGQSNKIDAETGKPAYSIREGDSRYLSHELLREDYKNLFKSDIFSLGISIYELARGVPLPKDGEEWTQLREVEFADQLGPVGDFSDAFIGMITECMHKNPDKRPTADHIRNVFTDLVVSEADQLQIQEELDQLQAQLESQKKEIKKIPELRKQLKWHGDNSRSLCKKLKESRNENAQLKKELQQLNKKYQHMKQQLQF